MSFFSVLFGFTLGLLFLAVGVLTLLAGQWIGLILVMISLLLLPPVRLLVYRRTGKRLTAVMRTFLVASLLALFVIMMDYVADSIEAELGTAAILPGTHELTAKTRPDVPVIMRHNGTAHEPMVRTQTTA